jgi:hypothetical protein
MVQGLPRKISYGLTLPPSIENQRLWKTASFHRKPKIMENLLDGKLKSIRDADYFIPNQPARFKKNLCEIATVRLGRLGFQLPIEPERNSEPCSQRRNPVVVTNKRLFATCMHGAKREKIRSSNRYLKLSRQRQGGTIH